MSKKHIHIIGGGVVGLCSAYFLQKEGVNVTVIDKGNLSDGTSHGNAGMIVPSHFVPLASPGVIAQGIKWMFDNKSPFYIKPRLSLELAQWMWQFYRSCTRTNVNRAIPILLDFNTQSKALYQEFAQKKDFSFGYEEKGLLMLYKTRHQEKEEQEMADRAHAIGVNAEMLSPETLKKLEPKLKLNVKGGLYFPDDAHLNPNQFLHQLIHNLQDKGVQFVTGKDVADFTTQKGKIDKIRYADGEVVQVKNLLLCSGSWTGRLLQKLGIRIYLQDGKGYSITLRDPLLKPHTPTILSEAKVAITPLGSDLRIGGTLEISNFSKTINTKRLAGIIESVARYYPEMHVDIPPKDQIWHGYRPCTPDGMPYIDQSVRYDNLYVATGHGMMGMSLGPATGRMVSEIFLQKQLTVPNGLMKIDRF